jgi:hypothetical protein
VYHGDLRSREFAIEDRIGGEIGLVAFSRGFNMAVKGRVIISGI